MELARWLALIATLLALAPALAMDPGVARGELSVGGRTIPLTHAYAHQRDNAEGVLGRRALRIVLADREIAQTLLSEDFPSALHALARSAGVQGVLLTMDPFNPAAGVRGVLLLAEPDPAKALATFAKGSGDSGFAGPRFGNNRVRGEVRHESAHTQPAFALAATFDAPLFRDRRLRPQRGSSSPLRSSSSTSAFSSTLRSAARARSRAASPPSSLTANGTRPRSRSRRRCSRRSATLAEPCAKRSGTALDLIRVMTLTAASFSRSVFFMP